MGDFLANLIDRAIGVSPRLERRRASVYEPVAEAPPQEIEGVAATDRAGKGGRDPSPAWRPAPTTRPHVRAEDDARADGAECAASEGVPASSAQAPARSAPAPLVEVRAAAAPAGTPERVREVVVEREHSSVRELRRLERERVVVEPARVIERFEMERVICHDPPAPQPERPAARVALAREPWAPAIPLGPPRTARSPAAELLATPRAPRQVTPPEQSAKQPAAPTVTVTIGHVEIRAAQPAPVRAARRSGPKLGLDEYLRKRSGGNR